MPAVTQVTLYDDEAWPERVLADEVVRLTVHRQAVDGDEHSQETFELYLTKPGVQKLDAVLGHWRQLGHPPNAKPAVAARQPARFRSGRDRREQLRTFVDLYGLRCRKDPSYPAYMTATGKNGYYPKWLDDTFEEWLAAGSPPPPQQLAS